MSAADIVSFASIEAAAKRLNGFAVRTPLLTNEALNVQTGRQVFLKPETLQVAGSFKFRGAFNRISQLSADERKAGVIAWSSGNHAQGVAAAAKLAGTHATIVMPEDAPEIKVSKTRQYGAEIVFYDRYSESREEIAYALADERGGTIVPSFDDRHIIAGQGTTGLEIGQDVKARGTALDALLVCCGGGGLIAGCATAIKAFSPDTQVFAVEPENYDEYARSLKTGRRERADTSVKSICDALLSPQPGELTFRVNKELLAGGLVVSETEVKQAMAFAFRELKLVVEPGGAVALAALLSGKLPETHRTVGIVLSGGNVDPTLFARILSEVD
ncbi:MAG: threonine/serine dehydratase [Pseudomonadota bacterium]